MTRYTVKPLEWASRGMVWEATTHGIYSFYSVTPGKDNFWFAQLLYRTIARTRDAKSARVECEVHWLSATRHKYLTRDGRIKPLRWRGNTHFQAEPDGAYHYLVSIGADGFWRAEENRTAPKTLSSGLVAYQLAMQYCQAHWEAAISAALIPR